MNLDNRLFVDGEANDPLPPIYKGKKKRFFPGQMTKNSATAGKARKSMKAGKSGLRRYVFRYENGKFVYLATRKGQRNGGYDSKPTQTNLVYDYSGSGISGSATFSLSSTGGQVVYVETVNSRIVYDVADTRWEWETRPPVAAPNPPSGPFYLQAFSSATSNTLRNSGTINSVQWTFVQNASSTATPQVPITVTITPRQWFNNNTVENLNKWPIKNIDANYNPYDGSLKKWQKRDNSYNIIPDNRPDDLTDEYLFRCFKGVKLKPYDIVFVEVVWRWRENMVNTFNSGGTPTVAVDYNTSSHGYRERIHDFEWWSPKPFYGYSQKGRVYRIGILEADTGVGGYDKVLWAQRTRIITTKWGRGGLTVLK